MILNIVLLIIGFVILIKGADIFVDGASSVAGNLKVPKILIGLTIVAFGTSAPELAVSIKSILSGAGDIVLGNVVGSNILNVLLILGSCSLVHSLNVKNNTVKKELPFTILITILFSVLISDKLFNLDAENILTKSDGIVILLFFMVFVYYLISTARKNKIVEENQSYMSMARAILFTFLGILGIVFGSNWVVDSASFLAAEFGISEKLISLTIIALGTSLPELVTSVIATKKGEYDLAIGNIVGSNIFNIGIVLGIPLTFCGVINNITFNYIDVIVMLVSTILLFLFSLRKQKITRTEGIVFLSIFLLYYSYVIYMG